MRRSPIVLAATVAGTAGIMAFHPHTPAVQPAVATTTNARNQFVCRGEERRIMAEHLLD